MLRETTRHDETTSLKQQKKFATQVDPDLLEAVREIAKEEGRQVQTLVDEALAGIVSEAAALWESLSQNHPFVDSNKRTACAVMFTFLAANEVTLVADEDAIMAFLIPLYDQSALSFDKLETWLRFHTRLP